MKMASRNPRWLEFLAFARMVKHLNRLGQTFSLHSADSFRCLVMPLSDLRIFRAPSSEASSSEASSFRRGLLCSCSPGLAAQHHGVFCLHRFLCWFLWLITRSLSQSATHVGLLHGQDTEDGNLSEVWWEKNHWKRNWKKKKKKKRE